MTPLKTRTKTPSNLSIALGISFLLWLAPATATADEELATPAELARLASRQQALEAKFDALLSSQVTPMIEDEMSRALTVRTTQLLRRQTRLAASRKDIPPTAMRATTDGAASYPAQRAHRTSCSMVEDTFECVARDSASR
jgi:hypothetical protein